MNKLLSQEEVDALLNGMSGGDVITGSAAQGQLSEVKTFDFTDRSSLLQQNPLNLGAINDRFTRVFCVALCSALRRPVVAETRDMEYMRFGEFVQNLSAPTSLHLFRLEPLQGFGLMVLESSLVFRLLEVFCGSAGSGSAKVEDRDFTPIENRLINKVVSLALTAQQKAWEPIQSIGFTLERSESNPQFVGVVPPDEVILNVQFAVELDEPMGLLSFCIPYASLEPIREQLGGSCDRQQQAPEGAWVQTIRSHLPQVTVEMEVELGRARISAREFLQLSPGDVIVLDKEFSDPLMAAVEGVPKLTGFAGLHKGKKAFRFDGLYDESD